VATYRSTQLSVFGKNYLFSKYPSLIYDIKWRWVQIQLNFLSNMLDVLLLISRFAADSRKRVYIT